MDRTFIGRGEIRSILRSIDWASTPLGPVQQWTHSQRMAARLCLDAVVPILLLLGPDRQVIYNEACLSIMRPAKHPWALGRAAHEVWPEFWERIAPELELIIERGESVHREDERFIIARGAQARKQETFVTYAATPLREEDGTVTGLVSVLNESTDRVRSALRREEILSFALETARMGAWYLDLVDFRVERMARHDALYGYEEPLPEWTYDTFLEHVLPEERAEVNRRFRRSLKERSDVSTEFRIRRRDGAVRWLWAVGRHVEPDADGHARMAGVIQDITERKQIEESRRISEEKFAKAFHGNASAMAVTRLRDGVMIEVNDRLLEVTGLTRDEVIGKSSIQIGIWTPDQREAYLRQLAQHGALRNFEHRFALPNGRSLTGLVSTHQSELDGEPILISSIMDITERKRAEEALRASEERFRALVTASSYLVFRMSPDWTTMRQYCFQTRTAGGEATTEWLQKYVHREDAARVMAVVRQAISTRSPLEVEHRIMRSDGSIGWLISRAIPIANTRGEIVEWFGAATDVTAKKHAELAVEAANTRLREADRRKDDFLAVLSHELRNPLAPIRSSLEILQRVEPNAPEARHAKEVLARQIEQLSHLINDLLDVTRISHGKIQLQRRRIELADLVRRTLDDQRVLLERSGLRFELALPSEQVFIDADWNRVAQVVANLLQNAAKFTPSGGYVMVRVERDLQTRQALIHVADTGVGMAPETVSTLFEPFKQADATLDRSKGGLGLGLALIKGLVEQHGGSVQAFSAGLGHGSEFTVRLPLDLTPGDEARPAPAPTYRTQRRVLVIEDNVDAAETLREVLELDGHEVVVAHDGAGGIAKARAFHPDLVLCDIGLPGMDGYAVARAFRSDEELKDAQLVALSGYALPRDLQRAADAGFERHLAKPASRERLEAVLAASH